MSTVYHALSHSLADDQFHKCRLNSNRRRGQVEAGRYWGGACSITHESQRHLFTSGVQKIIGNGLKHIQEANSHELNPFCLIRAATQNRAAEIK